MEARISQRGGAHTGRGFFVIRSLVPIYLLVALGVTGFTFYHGWQLLPVVLEAYKKNPDVSAPSWSDDDRPLSSVSLQTQNPPQLKALLVGGGGFEMKGKYVEEARELGGLLLTLVYIVLFFVPFALSSK
jgi:hypothetical protein